MRLNLSVAEHVARATINHAKTLEALVCIAVCDGQGRLVAFLKMDGSDALSGHEAIRRAMTSAGTGLPSDNAFGEINRAQSASNEGLGTSFRPGGLPLILDGEVVGGIGVCGGTALQDINCARAGAAMLDA